MILLRELIDHNPKACFVLGPAGSGKSSILDKLFDLSKFKILNVDDHYEKLLKQAGIGLDQTKFGHDELSIAAKLMYQSHQNLEKDFEETTQNRKNLIIDSTGGSLAKVKEKKEALEDLGYETFMVMLFVSPLVSLKRNAKRERQLKPSIILRTWKNSISNIPSFKKLFGDNFILINNNPKEAETDFTPELLEPYFGSKSEPSAKKEKISSDIKKLMDSSYTFSKKKEARQSINNFLSK